MQVTKELIENDISNITRQLDQSKAQVAQLTGALATLEGVLAFINKPEEEKKPEEEVSKSVEDNTSIVTKDQVGDNTVVTAGSYNKRKARNNV